MCKKFLIAIVVLLLVPSMAWSVEVYRDGDRSLDIGYFGQAWYQWVEDGSQSGDKALNDFLVRRSYLSIKGSATPMLDFFVHYATDKTGKTTTAPAPAPAAVSANSQPIVVRDGYMRAKLMGEALMVNVGRMYVPFTRTPSTKCLLTLDIDWTQGGNRGASFLPGVGGNRDDGVMVWGNLMDDNIRYRLMVADGIDSSIAGTANPDDSLRYTGQVSVSLMEPEKGYFNPQTYLGKKSVLSILAGFDMQSDLTTGDYSAWTAEVHYDQPIGNGGVTVEVGYIDITEGANDIGFTNMLAGDDATIISAKAGYILPMGLQPVVHYEKLDIDGKDGTDIYGAGLNYFVKGHANKVTLDVTQIAHETETATLQDQMVVTVQLEIGF